MKTSKEHIGIPEGLIAMKKRENTSNLQDSRPLGLLVLDYGTPNSLEDVKEYYTAIRRGKAPTDEEVRQLIKRYEAIGGSSPLQTIVKAQGIALQRRLEDFFQRTIILEFGHKFVSPSIEEAESKLVNQGIDEILVILMAPYHSQWNEESYFNRLQHVDEVTYYKVPHWSEAESFVQFWVQSIEEQVSQDTKKAILFTAHSVPQYIIDEGDSYKSSLEKIFYRIGKELSIREEDRYLAWQSAGKHGEWLHPSVEEVTKDLHQSGYKQIIYAPIGFTSLHLEVLYDNDIECKHLCESLQMLYSRARMPETDEMFIEAMSIACIEAYTVHFK